MTKLQIRQFEPSKSDWILKIEEARGKHQGTQENKKLRWRQNPCFHGPEQERGIQE
jgi:hypothetical protein